MEWGVDDTKILSGSGDQTAAVWDTTTLRQVYSLRGHTMSVKCVKQNLLDQNMVLSGSRDGSAIVWDLRCEDSKVLRAAHDLPTDPTRGRIKRQRITAGTRSVTCVDFVDDKYFLTGGAIDG